MACAVLAPVALVACISKPAYQPITDGGAGDDDGGGRIDAPLTCEPECPETDPCFEGVCGGRRVKELVAGEEFGCALLTSGSVYCWGANEFGQLGNGEDVVDCGLLPCRHAPRPVLGLRKVVKLAGGAWSVCAVQDDTTVACWGRSELGAIGHDPVGDPACAEGKPCSRSPVVIEGLEDVTDLSLSEFAGCARSSEGSVSCWGLNRDGNAGDGTSGAEANANLSPGVADITGVDRVVLSSHYNVHACAILDSGGVACWGQNSFGSTGHAPGTGPDETCAFGGPCTATPTAVAGLSEVGDLLAGSHVTCAVNGLGELRCTGHCGHGITGTLACATLDTPTQVPDVPTPGGFVSVSGRYDHACAVQGQEDRSIWCWGLNAYGQLGRGSLGGDACEFGPCRKDFARTDPVLRGTPYPARGRFTLAVDVDGVAWGWGSNVYGETGHPPGTHADDTCSGGACNPTPVPIEGLP